MSKRKRTKKQYNQFQKAFHKWWKKYRDETAWAKTSPIGTFLYNNNDRVIAEYIVPDYINYIKWVLRKYL